MASILLCLSGFIEAGHLDQFRHLKDLGYDSVKIPILRGGPQYYDCLDRQLDSIGLRRTSTSVIPSMYANPMYANPISSDPDER
ncbi:MAG: hypothetical protein MO846_12315 [Candidatus Devosia symbiotica]|nr:hypothetical protein [Candidatus Devosia symbiotica]